MLETMFAQTMLAGIGRYGHRSWGREHRALHIARSYRYSRASNLAKQSCLRSRQKKLFEKAERPFLTHGLLAC